MNKSNGAFVAKDKMQLALNVKKDRPLQSSKEFVAQAHLHYPETSKPCHVGKRGLASTYRGTATASMMKMTTNAVSKASPMPIPSDLVHNRHADSRVPIVNLKSNFGEWEYAEHLNACF